jgi:four helix bundle protein
MKMLNLSHKKLDVWKLALQLVIKIYKLTDKFPHDEKFGLTLQLRRASVSSHSNLSEGLARISKLEKRRFLEISRSSIVEIDTQLEISLALKYCLEPELTEIEAIMNELFAKISKMMSNLELKK